MIDRQHIYDIQDNFHVEGALTNDNPEIQELINLIKTADAEDVELLDIEEATHVLIAGTTGK